MRRNTVFFALGLWGLLVVATAGVEPAAVTAQALAEDRNKTTVTIDELIQGLARTEALIKDLDVVIITTKVSEDSALTKSSSGENKPDPQHFLCRTVVDSAGRMREEGFGEQLNRGPAPKQPSFGSFHWLTVFDGTDARQFVSHELLESPTVGLDAHATWYAVSPLEFTTQYFRTTISSKLRDGGGTVVGTEDLDGQSLVVAETKPSDNETPRKTRFWVNTNHNFTVVRRAVLVRHQGDTDWKIYTHIDGKHHQQVVGDIWLPTEAVYESLETHPGDDPPTVAWRYELALHDWKVNRSPPIATFRSPIPEGAWVNDHRTPGKAAYRHSTSLDQPSPAGPGEPAAEKPKRSDIYDAQANGASQVREALIKARTAEKRVVLMYGGNWCGWCYKLHDLFEQDAPIRDCLQKSYELVMINIDTEANKALAKRYQAEWQKHGLPYLTVLDADDKVLVNQNTSDLEDGSKHHPGRVLEFLLRYTPQNGAQKNNEPQALPQ